MGSEDEVERSFGRSCRQMNSRSKRTCELTSSIVPRGTSFHRSVELEVPPIAIDPARFSRRCNFPGPPELGAVNPDAVHDHGQPTRQRHDRLLHSAVPGDLHGPGLEPGPLRGTHQHDLRWRGRQRGTQREQERQLQARSLYRGGGCHPELATRGYRTTKKAPIVGSLCVVTDVSNSVPLAFD